MSQACLFDFEPPPKNTDRLFFAVMPDPQAIAAICALTPQLKEGRPYNILARWTF